MRAACAVAEGNALEMAKTRPGSLWESWRLPRGLALKNRVIMAPMTTQASEEDGTVSPGELAYLRRRAAGGVAAVITACTYVDDRGKAFRGIGAAHDRQIGSLAAVVGAIRQGGALPILQLYDSGRLAPPDLVSNAVLRAPSAIASSRPGARIPSAMTAAEVSDVVERFGAAARRAKEAGFDGIELHGANHYLLHQFFSPRSNQRDDAWGGSLEKRMAFPLAVIRAVKDATGGRLALGYRVTPFETETTNGITLADTLHLVAAFGMVGLDYVHVSLDNYVTAMPLREDRRVVGPPAGGPWDVHPVHEIARVAGDTLAVIAVGGVWTESDAMRMLTDGADAVALGRALLVDPEWPEKMREGRPYNVRKTVPRSPEWISATLDIPPRMVQYLFSRPGLIPFE
jgi:2,4-dienoyl-CoA reductase-like NADH-dependent reductase (Old Yellow Enzyme family)